MTPVQTEPVLAPTLGSTDGLTLTDSGQGRSIEGMHQVRIGLVEATRLSSEGGASVRLPLGSGSRSGLDLD